MSSLGYFPGCSLERSAHEYDVSSRIVCRQLGIELQELSDWSCCGTHAAHHTKHLLALGLSARNLSIAAACGLKNVVAPCPACYNTLKSAQSELEEDPHLREQLKTEFGLTCDAGLKVVSLLEFLAGIEPERFKKEVKLDLSGLKVVTYYGCLLVRPPKLVQFDDPENPSSMDNMLTLVGVRVLPWDYKVQCCGSSLGITDPEIQFKLSGDILEMAQFAGAQAIAVACPLCHVNLDLKQNQINKFLKHNFNIPILYFTQLLGLAFGYSPKELGIDKHLIDAGPVLAKAGIK
jgi:heterodisulfide reductase subunit B